MRLGDASYTFWTRISFERIFTMSLLTIVLMILGLSDLYFFSGSLNSFLGNYVNPNMYFIYIGFPHIFASFLTLFHKDYFFEYKNHFGKIVLPIFLISVIVFFINFSWYKILFCFLLSYHIGGQAVGVTKMFLSENKKHINLWKNINILLLFVGFVLMYAADTWIAAFFINIYLFKIVTFFSVAGSLVAGFIILNQKANKQRLLVLFLQIQFLGIAIFSTKDNFLFWGLMITLIHDSIAFLFYFNHEKNSSHSGNHNLLYPFWKKSLLPILLLSIVISYSLTSLLNFYSIPYLMFSFQIMHYLIESDIWKSGSPHRKHTEVLW